MGYQPPAAAGYDQAQQRVEPQYANWLYRVAAYVIDGVVNGAPWIVAGILIGVLGLGQSADTSGAAAVIYGVGGLASLGVTIWNSFIRQGRTGQSLGKQALGTRLVSFQTGQPIGGLMAFLRQLAHFVDTIACYIGWLWPIWDSRRQTFADKIMNTVVVRA
jgi:uncharacterized RDD family membrane protein YckC